MIALKSQRCSHPGSGGVIRRSSTLKTPLLRQWPASAHPAPFLLRKLSIFLRRVQANRAAPPLAPTDRSALCRNPPTSPLRPRCFELELKSAELAGNATTFPRCTHSFHRDTDRKNKSHRDRGVPEARGADDCVDAHGGARGNVDLCAQGGGNGGEGEGKVRLAS